MSELWKLSICLFLLCLDEDVLVFGFQDTFADELLSDGNGHIVGHTQVGQVVQEPTHTCGVNTNDCSLQVSHHPHTRLHSPGLSVLADQTDEGLHLGLGDVLFQQLSVVVQQSRDGVLS